MRRTIAALALALLFATAATAIERTYDETFDFSAVRSFAWVEKPGMIAEGDSIRVFMPNQPAWPGNLDHRPEPLL